MNELSTTIERAWGWTGLHPKQVLERNAFGNLLVLDQIDRYWRICPEDLSCVVVAENAAEFVALRANADFQLDWEMVRLISVAQSAHGPIREGRAYCLRLPSVLGGMYEASNIGEISLSELIAVSGDLALQIKDLPDGASVKLQTSE